MNDPGATTMPSKGKTASGAHWADTDVGGGLFGLLAEFETPAAIMDAADKVREAGYRWWDCHTPFPVHGLDKVMGIRATILPLLVFGAGLTGTTIGFVLQWFTNATDFHFWLIVPVTGYDFLVSGKPFFSLAVYPIVCFELTVLFAAIGAVVLMLVLNGLPQLYHPVFKSKRFARATDDRFFILIEARDPRFYREKTEDFLRSLGAAEVEALEA